LTFWCYTSQIIIIIIKTSAFVLVTGIAGCGATVVHDLVYNPAEGELFHFSVFCYLFQETVKKRATWLTDFAQ